MLTSGKKLHKRFEHKSLLLTWQWPSPCGRNEPLYIRRHVVENSGLVSPKKNTASPFPHDLKITIMSR